MGRKERDCKRARTVAAATALDEPPVGVWLLMTRFINGADLFALACVSRVRWEIFSQDAFWQDHLTVEGSYAVVGSTKTTVSGDADKEQEDEHEETQKQATTKQKKTALQLYMRVFSYKFEGLPRKYLLQIPAMRGLGPDLPH